MTYPACGWQDLGSQPQEESGSDHPCAILEAGPLMPHPISRKRGGTLQIMDERLNFPTPPPHRGMVAGPARLGGVLYLTKCSLCLL